LVSFSFFTTLLTAPSSNDSCGFVLQPFELVLPDLPISLPFPLFVPLLPANRPIAKKRNACSVIYLRYYRFLIE